MSCLPCDQSRNYGTVVFFMFCERKSTKRGCSLNSYRHPCSQLVPYCAHQKEYELIIQCQGFVQLALHRGELSRSEVCHIFTTPTHKEQTHFRHTWMTCLENQTNGDINKLWHMSRRASINKRKLKLQSEWDGMDGWTDKGQVVTWNQMLIISSTEQFAMQWHHPSACFDFELKKQEAAFVIETDWTDLKRTTAWCGCFFFISQSHQ